MIDAARSRPPGATFFPALFVVLWSTGFIAAKYGLPHAPPFTFLLYRFLLVTALMFVVVLATKDAHAIYARCGFVPLARPERFMEINRPDIYRPDGD